MPPEQASSGKGARWQDALAAFEEGCLASMGSISSAHRAFKRHGIRYLSAYNGETSEGIGLYTARTRIQAGPPIPGDRTWDARLYGCSIQSVGLGSRDAVEPVRMALARYGYQPIKPLSLGDSTNLPSRSGYLSFRGEYQRNGERFVIRLAEAKANTPPGTITNGDVVYRRGNARTIFQIESLKIPPKPM
ncbi:hypothetical protein FHY55_06795 [Oceanicola sp. D3]|uniref:hypothetical protein n=1 Tax=Oceanicola sp. D3 TaxID=2587163 RepID=UPI001120CF8A|nr:hypothetical protein [Oceanicola sp. D3]QDC08968.1 hypothetical protein FHY55_06795 [Oceanicola sp. D3]